MAYYCIPTTLGAEKMADAAFASTMLHITHMVFGDANGVPYLPETRVNELTLVHQRYQVALEYLDQDPDHANVYIAKARIPAAIGGFEILEVGLRDEDGDLIFLANYPRTVKPVITEGAGGELIVKLRILVSHSGVLQLVLDPHVITLTVEQGDDRYALKTELAAEASTRAANDLALSISLAAEITNRQNADSWLLGLINANNTVIARAENTATGNRSGSVTLPSGCRSLFVAINASGGRGGGSGDNGGQGGGAGAGAYLRVSLVGNLSNYVVEYFIQAVLGNAPVPPYGHNDRSATDNPPSWLRIWNPNTGYVAEFIIGTGQNGGQADGETGGGDISYGGAKGRGGTVEYYLAGHPYERYDVYYLNGTDGEDGRENIVLHLGDLTGHGGYQYQGADQLALGNPYHCGDGGEAGMGSNQPGLQGGMGYIQIRHSG